MINIFVDARSFQDPNYAFRGIGRHGSHFVRILKERGGADVNLVAVTSSSLPAMSESHRNLFSDVVAKVPVRFVQGDCFFQPSPMTHDPAFLERFLTREDLFKAAIIHDFIPYDVGGYLTSRDSGALYEKQLGSLSRLDAYFPNSRFSGRRLREICGVEESKIHVTGIAVGDLFFQAGNQPAAAGLLGAIGAVPQGYYFFVGGGDKRKNTPLAIQATAACNRLIGRDFPLIVCGSYTPEMAAELSRLESGHRVVFLSGLSDAELACLYHNSLLTLSPSFIEGFSIPVVEAIAAGSPVFLSDCEAHRELYDSEEALFPADDFQLAADKMSAFLLHPETRGDFLHRQSGGIQRYSSAAVGDVFWQSFAAAYRRHRDSKGSIVTAAIHDGDKRPKIAFMTPWPPERSGVADYSLVTCRALSKLCRLDVFTAFAPGQATDLPDGRILDLDSPELLARNYDHIVHVIGNSPFHKPMLDRLAAQGGAAVIHDARLFDFYYHHLSPPEMQALTERFVGRPVSRAEIDSWINRPSAMESLFLDEVLDSADPIIVHDRGLAAEIHKRYGVSVRHVPFAMTKEIELDIFSDTQKKRARTQIGIRPDRLMVAAFGFVGPARGDTECIHALRHLADWGYSVDFWFIGQVYAAERSRLEDLAESMGVGANLFFADGYIPDPLYTRFLLAADFAVQLRKGGPGQVSGTVVDCVGVGLPCVSNHSLAASVEAPSYVRRIPDVISPLLIAETIANGVEAGLHKSRHDEEREKYRREHSPKAYAEKFIEAIAP